MKRNRIVSSLLFIFMVFALVAAGSAKDETVKSQWIASPPSIDGMNTEWGNVSMSKYKKAKIEYAFMNDAENLFVLFIFKDPKFLSSIQWTGLTIWISPEGQKEKDLGIKFLQKQISADEYIAILEKQVGQEMPEDRKAQIRQNKAYMMFDQLLINKKAEGYDKEAVPPKYQGALFRNNILDRSVLYEVSISLPKLAELAPEIGLEPGKGVNLNFEWGGATKEYKEALTRGLAQSETRASAGQATSGYTDERGGGSLADMDPERGSVKMARMRNQLLRVKQYDFWVALNLAQNQ
jgi:hypothetical protein